MILYDENGCMLAADMQTIELFGYDNIDSFKSEVSDIADFFIEKEGYLYKFKNFNWIDFVNYSEENLDRVLIKKGDALVEFKINIKELFSTTDFNSQKNFYIVNITEILKQDWKNEKNTLSKNIEDNTKEEDVSEKGSSKKGFDFTRLYKEISVKLDVDEKLYKDLLSDFLIVARSELKNVYALLENGDYQLLDKKLKKLNSISYNLRLLTFAPIFNSIDRGLKSKNFDNIEKFLRLFDKELENLSAATTHKGLSQ